jgi:hypothetical protein
VGIVPGLFETPSLTCYPRAIGRPGGVLQEISMDAYTNPDELNSATETGRRRKPRKSALAAAIAAIAPDERKAAIAAAMREVEEEERRAELLDKVQLLSTTDLERLLGR